MMYTTVLMPFHGEYPFFLWNRFQLQPLYHNAAILLRLNFRFVLSARNRIVHLIFFKFNSKHKNTALCNRYGWIVLRLVWCRYHVNRCGNLFLFPLPRNSVSYLKTQKYFFFFLKFKLKCSLLVMNKWNEQQLQGNSHFKFFHMGYKMEMFEIKLNLMELSVIASGILLFEY